MLRKVTLSGLFAIAQMVGLAGVAVAQTTIINTTNACINSTYIFSSPMGAPVSITIDRKGYVQSASQLHDARHEQRRMHSRWARYVFDCHGYGCADYDESFL